MRLKCAGIALILVLGSCASDEAAAPASANIAVATAAPTTAPVPTEAPPTRVPAPTALVVPTPAPTIAPAPTVEPDPTAAPTTVSEPLPTAEVAAPAPATAVPTPLGAATDSTPQEVLVANGAEVYTLTCARCHGENGLGTAQYRGIFGVGDRYTTAGMIEELTNGHPVTFGFADRLSADEIASVVAFVKATFP